MLIHLRLPRTAQTVHHPVNQLLRFLPYLRLGVGTSKVGELKPVGGIATPALDYSFVLPFVFFTFFDYSELCHLGGWRGVRVC